MSELCPRCGAYQPSSTSGTFYCSKCGYTSPPATYKGGSFMQSPCPNCAILEAEIDKIQRLANVESVLADSEIKDLEAELKRLKDFCAGVEVSDKVGGLKELIQLAQDYLDVKVGREELRAALAQFKDKEAEK